MKLSKRAGEKGRGGETLSKDIAQAVQRSDEAKLTSPYISAMGCSPVAYDATRCTNDPANFQLCGLIYREIAQQHVVDECLVTSFLNDFQMCSLSTVQWSTGKEKSGDFNWDYVMER